MKRNYLFKKFENVKLGKNSRILLISHNDMDGTGPSIILKSNFTNVDIIHVSNERMNEVILSSICEKYQDYDCFIICDISCNNDSAKIIEEKNIDNKIVLLDHHATSSFLNEFDFAVVADIIPEDSFNNAFFDISIPMKKRHTSGTALLLDFLIFKNITIKNEDFVKQFSHMVAAYDTWDWVKVFNTDTTYKKLNILFYILGLKNFTTSFVDKIEMDIPIMFSELDITLLHLDHEKMLDYCDKKMKHIIFFNERIKRKNYSVALVNAEQYLDDVIERMIESCPTVDICIVYTGSGFSFRTRKEGIKVNEIAKIAGGGGHEQASGCGVSNHILRSVLQKVLKMKAKSMVSFIKA